MREKNALKEGLLECFQQNIETRECHFVLRLSPQNQSVWANYNYYQHSCLPWVEGFLSF